MELVHLLSSFFFQNLKVPLCTSTITYEFLIALLTVEKNNTTLMYTVYANVFLPFLQSC